MNSRINMKELLPTSSLLPKNFIRSFIHSFTYINSHLVLNITLQGTHKYPHTKLAGTIPGPGETKPCEPCRTLYLVTWCDARIAAHIYGKAVTDSIREGRQA
jgi:hypothetical protein